MALLGFMSPEEKDALMNEVEAQTVPDDVETAEDMLFSAPDPEMDAIDAEPVDPSVKALFDETAIDIIVADLEQKVSAGLGQADPRVQGLIKYWTAGEGGKVKVRWGTPGDGKRCIRYMTKYIGPKRAPGFCQTLHKRMVGGRVMGQGPGESRKDGIVELEIKNLQGMLSLTGIEEKDLAFSMEEKVVRHVRTPAGVKRYKRPIGTVIGSNGAALKNILEVASEYEGWNAYKKKGSKKKVYVGRWKGRTVVADADDNILHEAVNEESALKWLDSGGKEPAKMSLREAQDETTRIVQNYTGWPKRRGETNTSPAETAQAYAARLLKAEQDGKLTKKGPLTAPKGRGTFARRKRTFNVDDLAKQ